MKKIFVGIAILSALCSYGQVLQDQQAYRNAETALLTGHVLRAFEYYLVIDRKPLNPDEIQLLVTKMAAINLDSIVDTCRADEAFIDKYIRRLIDSTNADARKVKKIVESSYKTSDYGTTIYTDISGTPHVISDAWDAGDYRVPCACPWMIGDWENADFYLRSALKCFTINPLSYPKPVKEYTLYYLKLLKAINKQESLMRQTQYRCTDVSDYSYFYRKVNGLRQYPRAAFLGAIDSVMQQYRTARKLVYMEKECRDLKLAIDALNLSSKKKVLYQKFMLAMNGDMANPQVSDNLTYQGKLLESLLAFCLKTEALWTSDTRELEKKLNNAVSAEQVRAVVMKY